MKGTICPPLTPPPHPFPHPLPSALPFPYFPSSLQGKGDGLHMLPLPSDPSFPPLRFPSPPSLLFFHPPLSPLSFSLTFLLLFSPFPLCGLYAPFSPHENPKLFPFSFLNFFFSLSLSLSLIYSLF